MKTEKTECRIYVACLAAYNAGRLHGRWIDAAQEGDAIETEVREMLAASPQPGAEEWAIHDYEGFGELRLSEFESFERIHALAVFIEEHEELGCAVLAHFSGDLEEAEAAFENYAGCYHSLADHAEELIEATTTIPDALRHYVDYDAMARDMELNGDLFTIETAHDEVHVFWSH